MKEEDKRIFIIIAGDNDSSSLEKTPYSTGKIPYLIAFGFPSEAFPFHLVIGSRVVSNSKCTPIHTSLVVVQSTASNLDMPVFALPCIGWYY